MMREESSSSVLFMMIYVKRSVYSLCIVQCNFKFLSRGFYSGIFMPYRGPPNLGTWSAMMGFYKVSTPSLVISILCY
jgi:hypothetical protein